MNPREEWLIHLMTLYKNDLMRMSVIFLKDRALAEDAVQETFVKAYQAMDAFRGASTEKTWLMRIAINTCRNIRRDRWFRFVDRKIPLETLPYPTPSKQERDLADAILQLPYKQKEVVLLYYYQGMTLQEIAETLGIAVSTISTRLKKTRQKLRVELEGGNAYESVNSFTRQRNSQGY